MEDKETKPKKDWMQSYLEHCETLGISKTIIKLFIHMQEQKYEQDHKEAASTWI